MEAKSANLLIPIPSHSDIPSNILTDIAANESKLLPFHCLLHFKSQITIQIIHSVSLAILSELYPFHHKLRSVEDSNVLWPIHSSLTRRQAILTIIRIGHSALTLTYSLANPHHNITSASLTIQHIPLEFPTFSCQLTQSFVFLFLSKILSSDLHNSKFS